MVEERVICEFAENTASAFEGKTEVRIADVFVVTEVADAVWPFFDEGRTDIARRVGRTIVRNDDFYIFRVGKRRERCVMREHGAKVKIMTICWDAK